MQESHCFLLACLAAMSLAPTAQPRESAAQEGSFAHVRGHVTDKEGLPLPNVNVYLIGTTDGAATASDGRFAFRTTHLGSLRIRVARIGFESHEEQLNLFQGDTLTIGVVLHEMLISLHETIVEADANTTGDGETATLQSLDVVTTAGAAADVFQAIKTFPGVAMVDEGAGLYVRGVMSARRSFCLTRRH